MNKIFLKRLYRSIYSLTLIVVCLGSFVFAEKKPEVKTPEATVENSRALKPVDNSRAVVLYDPCKSQKNILEEKEEFFDDQIDFDFTSEKRYPGNRYQSKLIEFKKKLENQWKELEKGRREFEKKRREFKEDDKKAKKKKCKMGKDSDSFLDEVSEVFKKQLNINNIGLWLIDSALTAGKYALVVCVLVYIILCGGEWFINKWKHKLAQIFSFGGDSAGSGSSGGTSAGQTESEKLTKKMAEQTGAFYQQFQTLLESINNNSGNSGNTGNSNNAGNTGAKPTISEDVRKDFFDQKENITLTKLQVELSKWPRFLRVPRWLGYKMGIDF